MQESYRAALKQASDANKGLEDRAKEQAIAFVSEKACDTVSNF